MQHTETKAKKDTPCKWICTVCGYVYDPAVGDPDSGIEPGTRFEDISNDWYCPQCGAKKETFEPVEE